MSENIPEQIWVLDEANTTEYHCIACDTNVEQGQTLVQCPRCKAIHHLTCWVAKSGCSTLGCSQTAHPSLLPSTTRANDPPPKDNIWILVALTILMLSLLIGGMLWGKYGRKTPVEDSVVILAPSGNIDLDFVKLHADIAAFTEQNTTTPIHVVNAPAGVLFDEKFVLMTLGKEPPDILILDAYHVANYAENEALQPLNELYTSLNSAVTVKIDTEQAIYGIPYGGTTWFLSIPVTSRYPEIANQLLVHLANSIPMSGL